VCVPSAADEDARRLEIPKADGRMRSLPIPTVPDRFIPQAIAQVVNTRWQPSFHTRSHGFRPKRLTQRAVGQLQAAIDAGRRWVVKLGLEAFFDPVKHDRLMVRLKWQVPDAGLLKAQTLQATASDFHPGTIRLSLCRIHEAGSP